MTASSSHWNSLLLSVAACLTTATQLRPASVPIGLGEILVVAWLALTVLQGPQRAASDAAVVMSRTWWLFWLVSGTALTAGAIAAHLLGRLESAPALRDALAFALAGAACVVAARQAEDAEWARIARTHFAVSVMVTGVLLAAAAFVTGSLGPVNLWFMEVRFTGWASNPNQFALLLVPIPFFAMRIAGSVQNAGARASLRLIVLLAVAAVGLLTLSDALLLAWVVGGAVLLATGLSRTYRGRATPGIKLMLAASLGILVILFIALFGGRVLSTLNEYAETVYRSGAQGSERLRLWTNGLRAIAQSPLVGLGPGPHSGQYGPFEGLEAHNTLIDWMGMTGLLGGGAFMSLVVYMLLRTCRAGQDMAVTAGLVATLVFSLFHFVFRQPIFWIYLVLLCARIGPKSERDTGSRE